MIAFRPQTRDLNQDMQDAKQFDNEEEMKNYVVELWNEDWCGDASLFTVEDLVIDYDSAVNDKRTGWEDSMNVCVKKIGDTDYMQMYGMPKIIGICATKFPKMGENLKSN